MHIQIQQQYFINEQTNHPSLTYEMLNLLLLGFVISTPTPSSKFEVSFDPCLNGFNFPSFFDTDEKNVCFLDPPLDDVVGVPFCISFINIFIFNSSDRNSSFSFINDTSA